MEEYIDKFKKLPTDIQGFFSSNKPLEEIKKAFAIFNVDPKKSPAIAREIGLIYVNDIKLSSLPTIVLKNLALTENGIIYGLAYEINQRIFARFPDFFKDSLALLEEWSKKKSAPLISEDEAWKKVLELEPWILEEEKEKIKEKRAEDEIIRKQQAQIENIPIEVALQKHPAVGEQLITSTHIKLKTYPEPVRPSIKNWLADYTFVVGISNHDPIVRGNYLFKNENALRLSNFDREKLSSILKSFEEKTPLSININTKQVIFSIPGKREVAQKTSNEQNPLNDVMPTEITSDQEKPIERQRMFQSDEERIGAWRRDLPRRETLMNESETENVRFSSPQKFSTERPAENSKPTPQNIPARPQIARINYTAPQRPIPKNVVNLREE